MGYPFRQNVLLENILSPLCFPQMAIYKRISDKVDDKQKIWYNLLKGNYME